MIPAKPLWGHLSLPFNRTSDRLKVNQGCLASKVLCFDIYANPSIVCAIYNLICIINPHSYYYLCSIFVLFKYSCKVPH